MITTSAEVLQRAEARCAHMPDEDRMVFLLGFDAGFRAHKANADTARFVRSLIAADEPVSVAGFLEGVAGARLSLHPVSRRCGCTDCRTVLNERERARVAQVASRKQTAGAA